MSLETNIADGFTELATAVKQAKLWINNNAADLTALSTTDKTTLINAINELDGRVDGLAGGGSASTLDDLTDVTLTTPAQNHILIRDGVGQFVNVLGTTVYQAASANLTSLAGTASTAYGRSLLELIDQSGLMGLLAVASETVQGKVELATVAEATTGTDTARAVTAAGVTARVNNLVPAASETTAGKVELATTAETTTGTDVVRAVHPAGVKAAVDALRTEILGPDVPALLNSLDELAAALGDDPNFAASTATALGNRVRTDVNTQGLTALEAQNARDNISVWSKAEIGDVTRNFVTVVQAGLA